MLRQLPEDTPWLVCLDESLAAASSEPVPGIPFFRFNRRIDAGAFVAFVERWIDKTAACTTSYGHLHSM